MLGLCPHCHQEFKKRELKYKFCSLLCANRFNKNRINHVILPEYSPGLAEFVGICLGDGYISRYQTAITLNSIADNAYIPYVIALAEILFPNIHVSIIKRRKENAIDLRINSSVVSNFLFDMGLVPKCKKIPKWVLSSFEFRKACVRGLIDTEGSISKKVYESKTKGRRIYYQLNFRNSDVEMMRLVRDTLLELKLKPTVALTKSLYLSNPNDIYLFQQQIGFSNPKFLVKIKNFSTIK